MPTTFENLRPKDRETLQRIAIPTYLHGSCYAFAIALHRGLGWSLVGVMKGDVIWHAVARTPNGKHWDVRGFVSISELGAPFNIGPRPVLKDISEKDLLNVKPVSDFDIERASRFAEALWPVLPWRKETMQRRSVIFLDELEALCRKHKVWIRAPFPAHRIILDEMCHDEVGFRISPTMTGQYVFDRDLS